jgi:hypothetical protein
MLGGDVGQLGADDAAAGHWATNRTGILRVAMPSRRWRRSRTAPTRQRDASDPSRVVARVPARR